MTSRQTSLAKAASDPLHVAEGGLGLPSNSMFPGSPEIATQSRIPIRSAVFAHPVRVSDRLTDGRSRYGITDRSSSRLMYSTRSRYRIASRLDYHHQTTLNTKCRLAPQSCDNLVFHIIFTVKISKCSIHRIHISRQ